MILTIGSCVKDDKDNSYRLTETLGEGGFGYVYKAYCENNGKTFAVKTLQNEFPNQEMYLSFQKEANQSKLIDSENVIKYVFVHDGKKFPELPPYVIMEYTEDGTLRDLIDNQHGVPFDNDTLVRFFLQLAKGMKAINQQLVHRDIKPANILNFSGTLKITDFGLSKIADESTRTMSFKNGGTPLYIAPEAWNNEKNTTQMDIYSMGIVFYELATLEYPYSIPLGGDVFECKKMHLYKSAQNPSALNEELSPRIVSIIIKMIEKPKKNRFRSWDEIISALEENPPMDDDISKYVSKAITLQNAEELKKQQEKAEQERERQEKTDFIEFVYSQFKNNVLSLIHEFASRFNEQYPGGKYIIMSEHRPEGLNSHFHTEIRMPSNKAIEIRGEIIFAENFKKEVTVDSIYYSEARRKSVNYIPQCNKRDVLLWCQVEDSERIGFNLLLLKDNDDIYGEWFILKNSTNALTTIERNSPFGFKLSELPTEINHLHATHVYSMELSNFSQDELIGYIANHI